MAHYHPKTKLWEGNVFTGICLSGGEGGVGTSHALWDRSHSRVPLEDLPAPVLTSSGGDQNTYGCQVGGMHPTGMLSWWERVLLVTALS